MLPRAKETRTGDAAGGGEGRKQERALPAHVPPPPRSPPPSPRGRQQRAPWTSSRPAPRSSPPPATPPESSGLGCRGRRRRRGPSGTDAARRPRRWKSSGRRPRGRRRARGGQRGPGPPSRSPGGLLRLLRRPLPPRAGSPRASRGTWKERRAAPRRAFSSRPWRGRRGSVASRRRAAATSAGERGHRRRGRCRATQATSAGAASVFASPLQPSSSHPWPSSPSLAQRREGAATGRRKAVEEETIDESNDEEEEEKSGSRRVFSLLPTKKNHSSVSLPARRERAFLSLSRCPDPSRENLSLSLRRACSVLSLEQKAAAALTETFN